MVEGKLLVSCIFLRCLIIKEEASCNLLFEDTRNSWLLLFCSCFVIELHFFVHPNLSNKWFYLLAVPSNTSPSPIAYIDSSFGSCFHNFCSYLTTSSNTIIHQLSHTSTSISTLFRIGIDIYPLFLLLRIS